MISRLSCSLHLKDLCHCAIALWPLAVGGVGLLVPPGYTEIVPHPPPRLYKTSIPIKRMVQLICVPLCVALLSWSESQCSLTLNISVEQDLILINLSYYLGLHFVRPLKAWYNHTEMPVNLKDCFIQNKKNISLLSSWKGFQDFFLEETNKSRAEKKTV